MADIATTRIFSDGEKNITAQKLNDIVASSAIQTSFVSAKPVASSIATNDNLLILTAGGTYAQAPFQRVIDGVSASQGDSEIWSVRTRSFNAVGNPGFEIDQRNCGTSLSNPASGTLVQDRWAFNHVGSHVETGGRQAGQVLIPGFSPNFAITQNFWRYTLTTAQVTLAATDSLALQQFVEGPFLRELINDVTSLSLLVRTSVAGLKFSVSLRDPTTSKSLVKLCTVSAANTWTLIQLPNLPQMTGGSFAIAPGGVGYILNIALAAGSTLTAPAADTWQTGNFIGAPGMNNFANAVVNSTFDIAFVQHEPGAVCSTLMDTPFASALDSCLRYYQKTYSYATVAGTATAVGARNFMAPSAIAGGYGNAQFFKPMAKVPTVILYNYGTGASGSVRDGGGVDHASAAASNIGDMGFGGVGFTTATTAAMQVVVHYTADTGW